MDYLDDLPEVMPSFVGRINFRTGDVTDENGEVRTLPDYRREVENQIQDIHREFCDGRDLSSDFENTPGNKPRFRDDWYYDYPSQKDNRGLYPSEISDLEALDAEDDGPTS